MKQYIVIGCGRFGSSVATTMHLLGHQVMAIDKSEEIIQNIVDKVTHAAIVDVTDEQALRSIGLGNFDVAIIAIGADIRASSILSSTENMLIFNQATSDVETININGESRKMIGIVRNA